jgi:hypothetical protein
LLIAAPPSALNSIFDVMGNEEIACKESDYFNVGLSNGFEYSVINFGLLSVY